MRFQIKHGLFLKSANKLLTPNTFYVTDVEAEITELREVFAEAVVEIKPAVKAAPQEDKKTVGEDDISSVKYVGKALATKLAEKGITTKSGLQAALADKAREEELKTLLGANYAKILAQFTPTPEK